METDYEKLKKINEQLEKLMGLPPMVDLLEPKYKNVAAERDGVVSAYYHEGFRMFLEGELRSTLEKSVLMKDSIDQSFFKGRITFIKQLLSTGHLLYNSTLKQNIERSPLENLEVTEIKL